MENYCKDCRFWKKSENSTGECHCKAPLPYVDNPEKKKLHPEENTLYAGTRWPLTKHTQFCGEFQEKE
jgi:hypothetical protein